MKIVIVGDGKVGFTLATELSREGHDIVIIDKNDRILDNSEETLDVLTVQGNGASLEIQKEAGVAACDLLIAATSGDEVNILCCMLARKLGCPYTIARVRNPEYDSQLSFLREDLGLSMTVNPEKSAAHEIFRLLQFPSFLKRDTFARGRVELVELVICPDSVLCGVKLERFYEIAKVKVLVCAVDRSGEITIPSGRFELAAGDKLTVTAATSDLADLLKNLNISNLKVHNVVIIGGSRIAMYLATELLNSHISVKLIEQDAARCLELSEILPDALIIEGSGFSSALIYDENIADADAVVTLTGIDEENLIMAMYAKFLGVPISIPKISHTEYSEMLRQKGIDIYVSPKTLIAKDIIRYVRAMYNSSDGEALSLTHIADGNVEALEFIIHESFSGCNTPLAKLNIKPGILIACITRDSKIIIPGGADFMCDGDTVIVVTSANSAIFNLSDILTKQA